MKTWLKNLTSLAVLMSCLAITVWFFWNADRGRIIGTLVFLLVIMAIVILSRKYEVFDRAVKLIFHHYFRISGLLVLAMAPISLFYAIYRPLLASLSTGFQIFALIVWGLILAVALMFIATKSRREQMYEKLEKLGSWIPFIYCFNVLFIAILFFGSVSYLLVSQNLLHIQAPENRELPGLLLDCFLWEFLDAAPVLDINGTLLWERPLSYDTAAFGWILLIFKGSVIFPILAAFGGYWKFRRETGEKKTDGK